MGHTINENNVNVTGVEMHEIEQMNATISMVV